MRNFLLLLAVAALSILSGKSVAQYCVTDLYTSGCAAFNDQINSFSTSGGTTNISNLNSGCSAGNYQFFSGQTHTGVQGSTVNFTLVNGPGGTATIKIFVDWNNNFTFEASEEVFTTTTAIAANATLNGSFVIPLTATPGVKRMRVRHIFGTQNAATACSSQTWGEVEDYNLQVVALTPCAGTPNAGTANSSITNILCPGASFTLGLSGSDLTSGLTYQWQFSTDNVNWNDISGATNFNHTLTQTDAIRYYRARVTCTNGGAFAFSGSVAVTNGSGPTYAPLPFTESFENTWMNTCNTREIPNNSWRNTPGTGNNSWRRNDDGAAAAWTTPAGGAYTPAASAGTFSARFHSNQATAGSQGRFDLHINANTPATNKRLRFDYINTSGNDSVSIHLSTDGGATFVRIDSIRTRAAWSTKTVIFASNSATTIIRFIAFSDFGATDIGLDNVRISDFDDCNGVPLGGTATSNAAPNICAAVPFTLSVTGQTDANQLSYQWERSTDGGATWTPIPGATSETFTTTQVATTIYRLRITCANGGGTSTSSNVTVTSAPIPNGAYTINRNQPTNWPAVTVNANFNSFADAVAAMSCGIGGPVVFNVVAGTGPYNAQLIVPNVTNTSATNTITFNGNGETIQFATSTASAANSAVIKLNGARWVRIQNFNINNQNATSGFGVQLINSAQNNIVENNTITLNQGSNSNTLAGIVMSGAETNPIGTGTTTALHSGNQIRLNTINGGFYGITLTATPAGGANTNNTIYGNTVRDFFQFGVYVAGSGGTIIDSNQINRPNRTAVGSFDGIFFTTQSNNARITRNRITNPFGGLAAPTTLAFNGINFSTASASAGNDNLVINNLVGLVTNTNGVVAGLNNVSSSSVAYLHNTISLDDATSTATATTRGLSMSSSDGVLFYNNMVSVTRGGTGLKHGLHVTGTLILGGDHNNIWVNGTNSHVGFFGVNRTTISDWRTATAASNLDVNSLSVNPVFVAPGTGDFCPGNAAVDNQGLNLGIVDFDINNNARDINTPDIGAFECTPPPCNIPPITGATVLTPTTVCQNLPVQLSLNIGPYGSGQTFQWQRSVGGGPWTNVSSPMLTPDTTIIADVTASYRVEIKCLSATEYTTAVLLTVNPAFPGGTYTINNNAATNYVPGVAGGNFNSFNDAYNAMVNCGILGPVVFNVDAASGPYQERLRIDSIRGTSEINTITFNGNGRTITFDPAQPPTNVERAVIKLHRADHIKFNNLVIDASNGASFGFGVHLLNNADSNAFTNCTIITSTTSTSNAYAGVVISGNDANPIGLGNTFSDGNVFEGNTITGGFYGITVVGGSTAPTAIENNVFRNNFISEFYQTGIYVAGTNNTIIDKNIITRPTRDAFIATNGIFSTAAANNGLIISNNRIRNLSGGNPASTVQQFAIYHNVDQAVGTPSVVYNNLISDLGGNGIIYGLYNLGADHVHYYHNTISLDSTNSIATGATRGYFQQSPATGIEFRNNLITIRRGGNGQKHAIFIDNTTSGIASNHNNFFVNATNAHVGFFASANRTTLADWRTASSMDANSLSIDPIYQNPATGDYRPGIQTLDNLGTTATSIPIVVDINDVPRNVPPDMGAFEFIPVGCTTPPVAGTASVTPGSNICLQEPITLDVTGHSTLGSITFQWQTAATSTGTWTNIGPLMFTPRFDTVALTTTWFRAAVTCNGVTTFTAPVQLMLNAVVLAGTYTIGNGPTTWPGPPGSNFATFQEAVSAMECGITGPVVFNVVPGTYTEQIRIGNVRNSSAVNTITFQSQNGNPASVNLTWASTTAAANYTLRLDSTRFTTFRNLTISATDATFGRAIELTGTAAFDSIVGSRIIVPVVSSAATSVAGIFAQTFRGNDITIKGNTIQNGAMGIYLWGVNKATLSPNNLIDSNIITGTFSHAINTNFQQNMLIRKNQITLTGPLAPLAYGIYASDNDSTWGFLYNEVTISNATTAVYGLFANNNDRAIVDGRAEIVGNRVNATVGNTGNLFGINIRYTDPAATGQPRHLVQNNVVSVHTTAATSYGIQNENTPLGVYWNNTVNTTSPNGTVTNAAFRTTNSNIELRNNIFSHKGGGRAASYPAITNNRMSNYNMYFTNGPVLIQGTAAHANLAAWQTATKQDQWSVSYEPAFVSNTDLQPNLTNPDVWAMHGRGVQIVGNDADINGVYRPQTLTEGVPDLGAFEFFPTAQPTILTATPATPGPNVTQTFMYGTDTVMRITWGPTDFPASVTAQRYSGVTPGDQPYPNVIDSMYFYVKLNVPNPTQLYDYSTQLFYLDPWQGSIPAQFMIGLGRRRNDGNAWMVDFSGTTNTSRKLINQVDITGRVDRYTGFMNPYAPPPVPEKDSSNRGRRFWTAYPNNNLNGGTTQQMVIYLSAEEDAQVSVFVNGTGWRRDYFVPAGTVAITEYLPKAGADNAHIQTAGTFDRGIYIESDVPIVAYSHVIGSTTSDATMLLPVGVWGYEYVSINITQTSWANAKSFVLVIADEDNTVVEVTPSIPVENPGMTAGVPSIVTLNRGDVLQVLGLSATGDLSGTLVKSIPNSMGECHPVAVFSGSGRTSFNVPCSGGGDFIIGQNFPGTAWGRRYLTAPTSLSTGANQLTQNAIRISVKDPTTQILVNGSPITAPYNAVGRFYQYVSGTADLIESDKPINVAQYLSGACSGVGDPALMYISPIEQAIKRVGFYRNNEEAIQVNYLTMIIPTPGLASLVIKDGPTIQTPDFVYPHTNLAGYSVVVKRWTSAKQQVTVESDSAFTGITYGLGSVESYAYNIGTLVKNLRALVDVGSTEPNSPRSTTICAGTPFTFTAYMPLVPTTFRWKLGGTANLVPGFDSTIVNPVPTGTTFIGGTLHYIFSLTVPYQFTTPGFYNVQVEYEHPDIEGCDKTGSDVIFIQVLPAPVPATIDITFSGCSGDQATITSSPSTANGVPFTSMIWTLPSGGTATGPVANVNFPTAGTFDVSLQTKTALGCVTDTTVQVVVNPRPVVAVESNNIQVCPAADTTLRVQSPLAGATYEWFTSATGGTAITSGGNITVGPAGTTLAIQNITAAATYYVEGTSAEGCVSTDRTQVNIELLQPLSAPVASVTNSTATSVTFSWNAITGAAGYQVSTDNGTTWITPSTGATGLSHTITGAGSLSEVCLVVRAVGTIACQNSPASAQVCSCTVGAAQVVNATVSVCDGTPATFTIQSPVTGVTYNWYDAATGGTLLGTGTTFTSPNVSGTTNFYVEPSSGVCIGTRTQVTANILPLLAAPVVTIVAADITVNSLTFRWTAIPGAAGYQVSLNNGTSWSTPSSGATGLSHTISGLNPAQEACIRVRAVGTIPCQNNESGDVCARTRPDQIFIPNTFTPNGDGKNDLLVAYGWAIQSIQFMVFNQWGEKIHEVTATTQDAQGGFVVWDGKQGGKVQPVGVYVYSARIVLKDGTVLQKTGALNIVR